ncbi:hypothetical protein [Hymenobacter sp. B81]|uniref:hypothetical protein n=1 Tax=Hymenobacter sp. B81 TaxID=3344878 RepID=UPI0037DC94E8
MARFTVHDESLNVYGFRILTKGIDISAFKKNPVMLYMHDRSIMPIGKWEDLRKEDDGRMTAEAVFDKEDEFAQRVESKVEQGILSACSVWVSPLAWSDKPEVLLPGQSRPTVTSSLLNEISIVDIPGNRSALKLSLSNGVTLADASAGAEALDSILPKLNLKTALNMDEILLALGLPAGASEKQIADAIKQLKLANQSNTTQLMLSLAKKAGLVTDANEAYFTKLAAASPELAVEFLEQAKPAAATTPPAKEVRLAEVVTAVAQANQNGTTETQLANDPRKDWTMRDYERKAPAELLKLKREHPEKYQKLYAAQYGGITV